MQHLGEANIGTGIHYPVPLHLQNAYKSLGYKEGDFPVSESVAAEIVSLPMFPNLRSRSAGARRERSDEFRFRGQIETNPAERISWQRTESNCSRGRAQRKFRTLEKQQAGIAKLPQCCLPPFPLVHNVLLKWLSRVGVSL